MSIASSDLLCMDSANVPSDDASTSGGAISTTSRPDLTQFSANAVAAVVSDGADTRTVTVTGRLATGAVDTEVLTLNGTTEVVGAKTWERIQKIVASATSGTRTVTFRQGSGGTTRATILPNETTRHISFQNASSDPSTGKTRYEKIFWKNAHGTLSLLSAAVTLTTDAASNIQIGLDTAVDASVSVANRLTAPGSVTYSDDGVALTVPGANLAAGSAIGVWIQQTLASGAAATKSTYTTKLSGSST